MFLFKANSEEFIPIFANNPRELKAFLEHMIEVDYGSSQGVYDTLLELRLQDWAHEQDPEVSHTQTSYDSLQCIYTVCFAVDKNCCVILSQNCLTREK